MRRTLHLSGVRALTMSVLLGALAVVGCGKSSPTSPEQPTYEVAEFVSTVTSIDGVAAQARPGSAPQPGTGPGVTPEANESIINGGSLLVRVRASSAFQVIYLYVGGSGRTTTGYFELRLSAPTTDTQVVVTFSRSIPVTAFDCVLGVSTSSGPVGAYRALPTRVVAAGTGDVQVSASWDALSDVDLHVIDPFGEEIYYGDSSASSGGELDLDSNAGCNIDRVNNENIRWPAGRAPSGVYIVRLDYWSSCGVSATNYVVTVNRGGVVSIFRGTFTGSGTRGGRGDGRHITTFSHGTGTVSIARSAGDGLDFPALVRPESRGKLHRK